MKFFLRFLAGVVIVGIPLACLVLFMHYSNRPDLRPVAIPPPLSGQPLPAAEMSPYAKRRASERSEYMRGYSDALKGRKAQP